MVKCNDKVDRSFNTILGYAKSEITAKVIKIVGQLTNDLADCPGVFRIGKKKENPLKIGAPSAMKVKLRE